MPPDVDRLAAAVVAVLEKAVLPLHARLDALDLAAAAQGADVAQLREAFAAADRDLLGQLGALRSELVALQTDLARRRRPRPPADPPLGDPPTEGLAMTLAEDAPPEVH